MIFKSYDENKLLKAWFALFCDQVYLAYFVSVVLDYNFSHAVMYNW